MAKFIAYTGKEELANLTFEWKISEFKEKIETAKQDEAVVVDDINVGETKWLFKVFPNGIDEKRDKIKLSKPHQNSIDEAVAIMCYSVNKAPETAKISISVMEDTESVYKKTLINNTFPALDLDGSKNGFGFHTFLTHKEVKDNVRLLSNGNLRLLIKMTVFGKEKTTRKPTDYDSQDIGTIENQEKLKVLEHIKDSWASDNFSDVHIKCGGQIFYCHRMILTRRFQYFRSMLENGMKESKTRVISLSHINVDVLKAILKFIYGGEIGTLGDNAVDLLKAAGMLIIEDLKSICEKYVLTNLLKVENVIDMVVMAETHSADRLKKAAKDMIVANSDDVVKQDGWKEKLANSPMLLIEIFEAMAANKAL